MGAVVPVVAGGMDGLRSVSYWQVSVPVTLSSAQVRPLQQSAPVVHAPPDPVQVGVGVKELVGVANSMPPITKSLPPHPSPAEAAAITKKVNTKIARALMTQRLGPAAGIISMARSPLGSCGLPSPTGW